MNFKKLVSTCAVIIASASVLIAQDIRNNPSSNHGNKFEQLGTILATPNEYRTAVARQDQSIGNKELIMILKQHWMKKNYY